MHSDLWEFMSQSWCLTSSPPGTHVLMDTNCSVLLWYVVSWDFIISIPLTFSVHFKLIIIIKMLMIETTQKAFSLLDYVRQCFDLIWSGSVMQDRLLQNYKLITEAGTFIKLNATVPSTKKNQQLKTKGWRMAKAHWREESEVEGEQAAHSLGAPFKVVPRPFLVPLHCICL